MKKRLLLLISVAASTVLFSQTTLSTYPGASANNGTAGITFELITNQSITLEEIASQVFSSGTSTYTLWYKVGSYSAPPNISTTSGWVQLTSGTSASGSGTSGGPVTFASGLNLVLQPGTYGFHMTTSNCGYKTWAGSPDSWTDGTVTINTGQNIGYGGSAPNPTFHPRQFCGSVTYTINSTVPNDIGVASIDSPAVFCAGTHDIVATIRNYGINQVDSFTVNWSVNSVPQTPVVKTNVLLDTLNGVGSQELQVNLGSWTFTANNTDTIRVWTSLPNNVVDTVTSNDSAVVTKRPAISGNFTINPAGTGSNNYTTFSSIAQDLSDYGVCGPIEVAVAPGTYNEQFTFDEIEGASASNYIRFYPDSGSATLTYTSPSFSDNHVMFFDKASWISFEDFNFESASSTYSTIVKMENGSSHNSFMNCIFDGYSSATTSSYSAIVFSNSAGNDYNKFDNCEFNGGSYAFYYRGSSTSSLSTGLEILNSDFNDQYYRGLYFYYTADLKFNYNTMRSSKNYSSMYGIQSYYCYDNIEIVGNDINIPGYAGLYLYYNQGTVNNKPLVANNFIRIGRNAGSTGYGIYSYGAGYMRIVNNTIATTHSTYSWAAIYVNGGVNTVVNNLIHDQNGYNNASYGALYYNGAFSVMESDYNNIYTNRFWGRLNSGENLADWQNSTGFDMHSLESDPGFTNFDSLRTCSDTIESAGTPLSYVMDDIDGDGRHPSTPDIGADEWVGSGAGSFSAGPDAIICDGKPAIIGLPSSGGLFNWSTGDTTATIEVSEEGEYIVAMTSGCGFSHVDTVQVSDVTPNADFTVNSVFLTGEFDNLSDNDWTRMWVVGTTPPDTFYSKDLTYVFQDNGPYDVTLYIYNDCDTDMVTKTWTGYVGIAENDLNNAIAVMPNPVSDVLNIEFTGLDGDVTVEMMNIQGQIVHSDRYMNVKGNARETIDVSSLNKGMYIVRFMTDQGVATKQIIVQ